MASANGPSGCAVRMAASALSSSPSAGPRSAASNGTSWRRLSMAFKSATTACVSGLPSASSPTSERAAIPRRRSTSVSASAFPRAARSRTTISLSR